MKLLFWLIVGASIADSGETFYRKFVIMTVVYLLAEISSDVKKNAKNR